MSSGVMFLPKLLFDPRGTISRSAFALAAVPIILLWFALQLIWLFAWALSFDGCTKYVPEQARLGLIHGHMVLRTVAAIIVCALLFPLFAMMVKRLRAIGELSAPPIVIALTAYAVAYLVGWVADYWAAYNCGEADRVVPRQRGYEDIALLIWLIAILVFSIMTTYLFGSSLKRRRNL